MADRIYANDLRTQVFNVREQSSATNPISSGQNMYSEANAGSRQIASNEGFYLDLAQTSAGDAAAESHRQELTKTKNAVTNVEAQTSKLSTKNQETQLIGNVGVGNKTPANLVHYIDEQRKDITQLELSFGEVQENLSDIKLEVLGIIEGDSREVNKTVLEQLQIATNQLKSAQEYLIKDSVIEAGENYTTVDGKLFWTGAAPGLNYTVAYNVCAKYWSTMAQIKNRQEYDVVMSMLRPKSGFITVWIGLGINPITKQICPTDGFTKWISGEPGIGSSYKTYTNISLVVRSDPMYSGMMNAEPNWARIKVLCQL
uniref:uncharacterized protein LOC120344998 n=1 Tax=Styela clava TaxID=7725 RepID=UPI00193992E8|nr:uncharacterized protein LOC120344998 [Styela clava]